MCILYISKCIDYLHVKWCVTHSYKMLQCATAGS